MNINFKINKYNLTVAIISLIIMAITLLVTIIIGRDKLSSWRKETMAKIVSLQPQKEYSAGWYGFDIKSENEYAFERKADKFLRLPTNQNITFNELCTTINKKCTTALSIDGFIGTAKENSVGCNSYKTPDTIVYCE